jgi:hypothetical protein
MSNQEFAKLWEDATAQYNETVGPEMSIGDRTSPKPRSVGELLEMIEHEHGKFSAFRERQAKFRLCLKYALAPVEMLSSSVSGAVSAVSNIYQHRHVSLQLANNLSDRLSPLVGRSLAQSCFCWVYVYLFSNYEFFTPPQQFPGLFKKTDSSLLDCEERRSSV